MRFHLASLVVPSLLSILLSSAAAPCQGGWKNLTGKRVPAIHADDWLNTDKNDRPSSKSLKGKVWLLEFFATT